jgi:cob(I)alamin adenosyltransferase
MKLRYLDFESALGEAVAIADTAAVIGRMAAGSRLTLRAYATLRADGEHIRVGHDVYFAVSAAATVLTESSLHSRAPSSAFAQVARSVWRRAERTLLSLTELDPPPENFGLRYLNRLSDLLLVASQLETRAADDREVEPAKSPGDQP